MKSNIRKLRLERQISQKELAKAIGKTQQTVSHMEHDRDRISIESLISMSEFFGVSTDYILGIGGEQSSKSSVKNTEDQNKRANFADEPETIKNMVDPGNIKLLYDAALSMLLCSLGEKLQSSSEANEKSG